MNRTAYKRGISLALKVAIVSLAAGYIVQRFLFTKNTGVSVENLIDAVHSHISLFIFVILLMPLNWSLEAWKWKIAAGERTEISFFHALKSVLAGVTIGTATPNRVGEFAGRVFMEKNADHFDLLLLSFICSFCQVAVTLLAGVIALLFAPANDFTSLLSGITVATALFFLSPLLLRILPLKWQEKIAALKTFPPKKLVAIMMLSTLRYSVYVFQFLLLVILFDLKTDATRALGCIAISYLIVTLIPTFSFTEVLVRGSVAGLVFSGGEGMNDAFVVAVLIWFINVAIPSLAGTFFVFRLKFFKQET